MYDKELLHEILTQILKSTDTVLYRFNPVKEIKDFTDSQAGMEKLDAICMQLIVIGESLKNIDKITNGLFLSRYPQINWKGAKAMRDIISHHYFEIDVEVIFDVCKNKIKPLRDTITNMIIDINNP
ncbi:MAG: DUF86 domain-containing protein [Desulfamplus sp.]